MRGTWHILWWTWSTILIAYLLLYVVAAKRLGGQAMKRSGATFWVIAVLAALRMLTRIVVGGGTVYRFVVLFAGVAAGLALLDLARMLITQPDAVTTDSKGKDDRIQSLKLS